ncbi:hypothetical protein DV872_02130 [Oceanispirochaeta sp. M1]|nr:hypothetical protein DV872_02130 [Oceanispirochaeta sp. M1]
MNHLEEKSNKSEGLIFVNGFEGFIYQVVQVVEDRGKKSLSATLKKFVFLNLILKTYKRLPPGN